MKRRDNHNSIALTLAASAVVFAALYFGKAILVPIALAALLSLFLRPVVTFLERYVGRVGAVVASVALSIALMGAAAYGVGAKIANIASNMPIYKARIMSKTEALNRSTNKWIEALTKAIDDLSKNPRGKSDFENATGVEAAPVLLEAPGPRLSAVELATAVLGPLVAPFEVALIVLIFTIFILIQRDDLRNRIVRLAGARKMHATSRAFDEAGIKLSRYLLMQSVINLAYGLLLAGGLYSLGVADGIVWGMLAAILRFVPYVGTWIAALPPFLVLLATTDGWQPAYMILLFLILDVSFPMIVEPLVIGSGMGISPLSLLVAAVFWTWLWGFIGLLLSTPLTVCLAVAGKHLPQFRFLNILLTDKPVLDAKSRFYQRLLSLNTAGALEILTTERSRKSLLQICDQSLVPVLSYAERDLHAGRIDKEKARLVRTAVSEWAFKESRHDDAPDGPREPQDENDDRFSATDLKYLPEGAVLCIPAHNEADEVSAQLFAAILKSKGLPALALSVDQLAGEVLRSISERQAGVVCICALPPFATAHSRYLYKRIRTLFPAIVILVGLWNTRTTPEKSRRRLTCAPADGVVSTFAAGIAYLNQNMAALILQYRNAPGEGSVQSKDVP
jgi:predicted PurR-regulated permease PerM